MFYTRLKTGKAKGVINERLSRKAQEADLKVLETVLDVGSPTVFSIPELSADIESLLKGVEEGKWRATLEAHVRTQVLKPGLSFMPPDDITWWETNVTLRGSNEANMVSLPIAVVALRVARDVPALKHIDAQPLWEWLDKRKWPQGVMMIAFFESPFRRDWIYSLAAHLCLGIDSQGEVLGMAIEVPDVDSYQAAGLEKFLHNRGIKDHLNANDLSIVEEILGEHCLSTAIPVLQALSLLNCRNVSMDTHKFQTHKQKKKAKGPMARAVYKTLKLTLPGRQSKSIGYGDSESIRALHMVRGHFSVYTEDAKLFGKLTGRFWIPSHARGSKEAGIIQKKYSIVKGANG